MNGFIKFMNEEYGLSLTGFSPRMGAKKLPEGAQRIIAKDYGNGLGRVVYVDKYNRLINNTMERL